MPFTDIHCHLLPGLDDGSRDWAMTESMLQAARANGIKRIIATPHANPAVKEFQLTRYLETLGKARELCQRLGLDIVLYPGCEIMYAEGVTERLLEAGKILGLADTRHTLVEFYPDARYDALLAAVRRLANAGYTAVLAHIERYACLYKKYDRITELKDAGAKLQVNCGTFVHKQAFGVARYLNRLLMGGFIDYLATDAHSDSVRKIDMKEAYDIIHPVRPDCGGMFEAEGLGLG